MKGNITAQISQGALSALGVFARSDEHVCVDEHVWLDLVVFYAAEVSHGEDVSKLCFGELVRGHVVVGVLGGVHGQHVGDALEPRQAYSPSRVRRDVYRCAGRRRPPRSGAAARREPKASAGY